MISTAEILNARIQIPEERRRSIGLSTQAGDDYGAIKYTAKTTQSQAEQQTVATFKAPKAAL